MQQAQFAFDNQWKMMEPINVVSKSTIPKGAQNTPKNMWLFSCTENSQGRNEISLVKSCLPDIIISCAYETEF